LIGFTYEATSNLQSFSSTLQLTQVTEADLGLYTCCASNDKGLDYTSAFVSKASETEVPVKNGKLGRHNRNVFH